MHKTRWFELAHLFWKCEGCCKQCKSCGSKPKDNIECDGSVEQATQILHKRKGDK